MKQILKKEAENFKSEGWRIISENFDFLKILLAFLTLFSTFVRAVLLRLHYFYLRSSNLIYFYFLEYCEEYIF